jgi:hypothetical protein
MKHYNICRNKGWPNEIYSVYPCFYEYLKITSFKFVKLNYTQHLVKLHNYVVRT